ncbi:MAG: cbb3-type cytochrome oxidase assembly protein CcoS [Verrucomicrobia bacterium]|nr:cbb3-type cytochrome oxidase assembly protein CcoS [Verrucomicrobiota bacterium]
MSVIFLLIPLSIALATLFLAAFIWAVRSGQYEDISTPSMRVLMEEVGQHDAIQNESKTFDHDRPTHSRLNPVPHNSSKLWPEPVNYRVVPKHSTVENPPA